MRLRELHLSSRAFYVGFKLAVLLFVIIALGAGYGRSKEPLTARQISVRKLPLQGGFHGSGSCALSLPRGLAYVSGTAESGLHLQVSCVSETKAYEINVGQAVASLSRELESPPVEKLSLSVSEFDSQQKPFRAKLASTYNCTPACEYSYEFDLKSEAAPQLLSFSEAEKLSGNTYLAIERIKFDESAAQNNLVLLELPRAAGGSSDQGGQISRTHLIDLSLLEFPSQYLPQLALFNDKQTLALFKAAQRADGLPGEPAEIWLLHLPGSLGMSALWGYVAVVVVLILGLGTFVIALMQKSRRA